MKTPRRKLRFILLISCLVLLIPALRAEKVTVEKAEKIAKLYVRSIPDLHSGKEIKLVRAVSRELNMQGFRASGFREETMYYVFGMDDSHGFIIVSADDIATPVLGYSENGSYDEDNPNFNYWMDCLAQEIAHAIENNIPQDETLKQQWDAYMAGNIGALRATTFVAPLLATQWNQTAPYSDLCPDKVYTGCVATAMAQIMKHYNYPATRTIPIPAYTTATDQWSVPAIAPTTYAWSSMTNTYNAASTSAAKTAVATLMYHCGAAAQMDYTSSGSGATVKNAGLALINYFNYDQSLQYKERKFYSNADWETLLKTELDAGRPLFYRGRNASSGHAFVCDGYNDNNPRQFHFNWGWGGSKDGYFVTTALNPGGGGAGAGAGTYNEEQAILMNILPNNGGVKSSEIKINAETDISSSATTLDRGESFSVNAPIRNYGLFNFSGYAGIAIVDASNNILSVIGQNSVNLDPGYGYSSSYTIRCAIPVTATTGSCRIRVVSKSSEASQWSIVTGTLGYTDVLNLAITSAPPRTHGIKIKNGSNLTCSVSATNRGAAFTVSAQYINRGTTEMTGDYGIALVDNNDVVLEIIGISRTNLSLNPNTYWTNPFDATCAVSSAIEPGNYKIRAVFRPTDENWSIIFGESGVTDILNLTVNSAIVPDESNLRIYPSFTITPNPIAQESSLSVNFGLINNTTGAGPFMGEIELALCDLNGVLVEVIAKQTLTFPNDTYYRTYTLSSPQIVSPGGTYLLTLFQKSIVGERKKVGNYSASIKNEVEVTVIGIPPLVTAVSPANGASDVPVEGQLMITFDKSMNSTSETGFVTLGGGIVSNEYATWSSNNTVCTISYSGLEYNKSYTYNISGFQDASGNTMDAVTSGYSFTTAKSNAIEKNAAPSLSVYNRDNTIYILSTPSNLIKSIAVYTMQGVLIYSNTDVHAASYSFSPRTSLSTVFLVKIVTENEIQEIKLIKRIEW